jgi:hypothetical protein
VPGLLLDRPGFELVAHLPPDPLGMGRHAAFMIFGPRLNELAAPRLDFVSAAVAVGFKGVF